jgi:hypothetical protein
MSTGAPNENGTPIRMPSVALLCVDSADANSYNSAGYAITVGTPAQIQINKQAPLLFGYMTRISLTEINLAWATPNVNERNNTLSIFVQGVDFCGNYRIAVSQAFHTPSELAASVKTALDNLDINSDDVVWAVTHSPRDAFFTISISGSTSGDPYFFSILPPNRSYIFTDTATDAGSDPVSTYAVEDDLTYMMGLTPPAGAGTDIYKTIKSGYASCQYTPYVDIVSSILTKNQNVRDNDSALRNGQSKLARVYLSEPGARNQFTIDATGTAVDCNIVGCRPFVIHREFQTPKVISWNTTENVDIVDLQVLDRLGYPIFIENRVVSSEILGTLVEGNTATFQFTIQVTET